ncbi:hypothetical protein SAMN05428988_5528 [Chitinophaga sp. YR573]|nr:hypothetical protein SAMN05428988_5528 [Chitinophaga sp. YR573]
MFSITYPKVIGKPQSTLLFDIQQLNTFDLPKVTYYRRVRKDTIYSH